MYIYSSRFVLLAYILGIIPYIYLFQAFSGLFVYLDSVLRLYIAFIFMSHPSTKEIMSLYSAKLESTLELLKSKGLDVQDPQVRSIALDIANDAVKQLLN